MDQNKAKIIIISGPTATGKTALSIELAKFLDENSEKTAIVNFDSLLFYKELSIGTAKPTLEERQNIPHYLLDVVSIDSPMNASDFVAFAEKKITELLALNIIPIVVGGSAFYLRALIKGMYQEEEVIDDYKKEMIKEKWKTILKKDGITAIVSYLKTHDPESLELFHINDHYRLTRACEYFDLTATPISAQRKNLDENDPYNFSKNSKPYDFIHFYLDLDKPLHFSIIEKRTKKMIADGIIQEFKRLQDLGYSIELKPLQSIGYKETYDYLNGILKTEADLSERISISTRQLAKSQRTFFNKIQPKISINPLTDSDKVKTLALNFIKGIV